MDIHVKENQTIVIGRVGENERIRVIFDASDLIGELGTDISLTLLHQRPGDTTAYPVPTTVFDGDELIWTVMAADTSAEGRGRCELICTVGTVIAKTIIWFTIIQTALDGSGKVPSVWESWQEVFASLKAGAETSANSALTSANSALQYFLNASQSANNAAKHAADASRYFIETEHIAHDVQRSVEDAESYASLAANSSREAQTASDNARSAATSASESSETATTAASNAESYASSAYHDKEAASASASIASTYADAAQSSAEDAAESAAQITELTATAETLPEGSAASASYDSTSGMLTLGIPTGATGYSPRASVTQTPDGAVISITDATGTTSATLTDGKIWDNLDAETDSYTPQVVIPCDDTGTLLSGVVTKRGRMLYINGVIPSNLRICIYGAFKGTRSVPSYANFPEWYREPFDGFVVGHTYRYVPEIISGTVESTGGNDMLVLRQKDDTYKSITAGSTIVCETLPEAIFVMPRTGTYTDVKIYLHIVDITASPVTDVQINGTSVVSSGIARIRTSQWELIREETVTNATETDIIINADSNGQAFELTDVRLVLVSPQQDTAFSKADYGRVRSYYQNGAYDIIFITAYTQAANASAKVSYVAFEQSDGMLVKSVMPNTTRGGMGPLQTYATEDGEGHFVLTDTPRVYNKINVTKVTGSLHYILYGKRKVV